jgi:molybdate transport system substrate-binding protein
MLGRLLLLLVGLLAGSGRADSLLIAAAADLQFALEETLLVFREQHPRCTIKVSYGSSGSLFAQIENGAPFDVFLSADADLPRRLIERGRAEPDTLFLYAIGRLAVWVPTGSKLDLEHRGLAALRDPSVRRIAIANPAHAPYGAAAVAALQSCGIYEAVQAKLILGENIAQAAQFAQSGAADAGVIALSLALAPRMKNAGRFWEVPPQAFPRLEQGGVIVTGAANAANARQLRTLMTSDRGREILQRGGFFLPNKMP